MTTPLTVRTPHYTDPTLVTACKQTPLPHYGHTVSGYGHKLPTPHMIRYAGIWRRVYVMIYSNSGTAYVFVKGDTYLLDIDTEYRLQSE